MRRESLTAMYLTHLFLDKTLRQWLISYQDLMVLLGRDAV
jgi:hypothetical protein